MALWPWSKEKLWTGYCILLFLSPYLFLIQLSWEPNHCIASLCLVIPFDSEPFSLQVFGTDKRYWFIPAYSEEDLRRMPALQGLEYPTRPELNASQPLWPQKEQKDGLCSSSFIWYSNTANIMTIKEQKRCCVQFFIHMV